MERGEGSDGFEEGKSYCRVVNRDALQPVLYLPARERLFRLLHRNH